MTKTRTFTEAARILTTLALFQFLPFHSAANTPLLQGRSVTKNEALETSRFPLISQGPASSISRLFWEEQYDLQDSLFSSLGSLGPEIEWEKEISDNYRLRLGADFKPQRQVIRVNIGDILDGVPDANAASHYIVVDQLRTSLAGAFDILTDMNDVVFFASPLAIEAIEIVRKLTPVRDLETYERTLRAPTPLLVETAAKRSANKGRYNLPTRVVGGMPWTINMFNIVYEKLGDVLLRGSEAVVDDESSRIFFVSPYQGVHTKDQLFTVDSAGFLQHVRPGETLNVVRTFHSQLSRFGGDIDHLRLQFSPRSFIIQTERTAFRLPPAECDGNVMACPKVRLSLKYTVKRGGQTELQMRPGLGPVRVNVAKGSRQKYSFLELEKVYLVDLSTPAGRDAFNLLYSDFMPRLEDWESLPVLNDGEGVRLINVYWRGEGDEVTRSGRVNLGLYKRRVNRVYQEYPLCVTEIVNGQEQPQRCNYSARSAQDSRLTNKVRWIRDSEENYVGLVGLTNPEVSNGQTTSTENSSNLHFAIHYNDRFADDYNSLFEKLFNKILPRVLTMNVVKRQDYYDRLANIRVALAVDQMPDLYRQPGFADVAARLAELKNRFRDIEHSLQNINVDIYMNHHYTRTVMRRTEEEARAALNQFNISEPRRRKLLQSFLQAQRQSADNQVRTLVHLYNKWNQKPYFAGLMLLLGTDHIRHASEGNLVIRFMSEASDLTDAQKFKDLVVGANLAEMTNKVFIPRNEFRDPEPGLARLSNIKVTKNGDKVYLEFMTPLKETAERKPLALAGQLAKFRLIKADEKLADLYVANVVPVAREKDFYRYVVELGDLRTIGARAGEDYTLQFRLIDPYLDAELPSRRLTETREVALRW